MWSAAVWAVAASGALAAVGAALLLCRRALRHAALLRRDANRRRYGQVTAALVSSSGQWTAAAPDVPVGALDDEAFLRALAEALDAVPAESRAQLVARYVDLGYVERLRAASWSRLPWRRLRAARWLGRLGHGEGLADLIRLTADRSPRVRSAAIASLGTVRAPRALSALLTLLEGAEAPAQGRRPPLPALTRALVAQGPDAAFAVLSYVQSPSPAVRKAVVEVLASVPHPHPAVGAALLVALRDPDGEVRARTARAFGRIGDPGAVVPLAQTLADPVWFVRLQAARALGALAHRRAVRPLVGALTDESWQVRAAAASALRGLGDLAVPALTAFLYESRDRYAKEQVVEELQRTPFLHEQIEALDQADSGSAFAAHRFLQEMARHGATAVLLDAVRRHVRQGVRRRLVAVLATIDVPRVIAVLHDLAEHDRDPGVRDAARRALADYPEPSRQRRNAEGHAA
ncbi:MAG: HEAT repeat domain-containing protein [Armatimonadota bacterium]|nr:HEAT repeat domain-containing protein [Armatimonadota bacterium]